MDSVLLRILSVALIALLGWAAFHVAIWWQLRRVQGKMRGLEGLRAGVPAILYFTTPTCQPCQTIQRPALKSLTDQFGPALQVLQVDATKKPELADHWGVLSVPTTFIIDSQGQPRGVNHGVASANKLIGQIEEAEGGRLVPSAALPNANSQQQWMR